MITNIEKQKKLIAVAGPTASGKTDLAIKLAKEFDGEIINVDSRQIYKYANIGTNKGDIEPFDKWLTYRTFTWNGYNMDQSGVIGWLFDIVTPEYVFTLAEYQELAEFMLKDIWSREKLPILVGGTGLYFDAILKEYKLSKSTPDKVTRSILDGKSVKELQTQLRALNKNIISTLNNSDVNNPRRLLRLIEKAKSGIIDDGGQDKIVKDSLFLYPRIERERLFKRIDSRVVDMVSNGLVGEVKGLIKAGYKTTYIMSGTGYKEVIKYIEGKIDKEKMIKQIQQNHRNYAKRQFTWFEKKDRGYNLKKYDFKKDLNDIYKTVKEYLNDE